MLFYVTCSALIAVLLGSTNAVPIHKRAENGPVITTDFPDPAVINVDNTWYAFGTQSVFDYENIRVQIATSTDFSSWTVTGIDALGTLPSWVDASNPLVWAPDVIQRDDGSFLLYFSATTNTAGNGQFHCIGTASSSNIEGPYNSDTDTPFACPTDQGGAIDPAGFRDSDGSRYIVYKIDGNSLGSGGSCGNTVAPIKSTPIMIQPVEEDGVTFAGSATEILTNDANDGPLVEGPSLMKASDGTYVLFFSSNCYMTTDYDVSYATSSSVTGGYTKELPLFVSGTDGLLGPGGATADVDGQHMVFHGYASQADVGGRRAMYTATIGVSGTQVSA